MILGALGHDIGTIFGLILMLQGLLVAMFGIFLIAQLDPIRVAQGMIAPQLEQLQQDQPSSIDLGQQGIGYGRDGLPFQYP